MKILVDNGHGVDTKGKRSPDGTLLEYKWAREVARMVCDLLQAEGYDASLLVPEEKDIALATRCARANKFDKRNTILVSIHNNAAGHGDKWMKARGWCIFTTRGITEADILAEYIWREAVKEFKAPLSVRTYSMNQPYGYDWENDFYIIKKSYCPAVLVENFFMDNHDDCNYLKTNLAKATCAEVIVAGVKAYLASK